MVACESFLDTVDGSLAEGADVVRTQQVMLTLLVQMLEDEPV